jgi:acetoin utilization protein AcuB
VGGQERSKNMLVKYWMRKDVVSIDVNDSMHQAINLMKQHNISILPVTKAGDLVGVVTDRDIKRASASDATSLEIHELIYLLSQIKIKEIMTSDPVTVRPDHTLEETAAVLLKKNISGVPVVAGGKLVGIITQMDLFRALISLSGLERRGVQFAFQIEDRPGSIKEVTDVIRSHGGRLVSILSSYDRVPSGYRYVYVRAYGLDRADLPKLLEELREKATLLYVVDHKEDKREEFVERA